MADIVLYTKGYCPYCHRAKALLKAKGVKSFTEYDLEVSPHKFDEMRRRSHGARTVPQIFINGDHIGGSDDLAALNRAGHLDALLKQPA